MSVLPSPFTLVTWAAWVALFAVWLPGRLLSRSGGAPRRVGHRGWQVVAVALLFIAFALLFRWKARGLNIAVTPADATFGTLGVAIDLVGIAFAIWARIVLGRNWSGLVMKVKEGQTLVQSGPYATVRHPIYTGLLAAILGTALTTGTLAAYLAVPAALAGLLIRVVIEDGLMAAEFGAAHAAYRLRTRRLIPFVW